jgi:fluoride ion exporter CrcB/FEX
VNAVWCMLHAACCTLQAMCDTHFADAVLAWEYPRYTHITQGTCGTLGTPSTLRMQSPRLMSDCTLPSCARRSSFAFSLACTAQNATYNAQRCAEAEMPALRVMHAHASTTRAQARTHASSHALN